MDPAHFSVRKNRMQNPSDNATAAEIDTFYQQHGDGVYVTVSLMARRVRKACAKLSHIKRRKPRFAYGTETS